MADIGKLMSSLTSAVNNFTVGTSNTLRSVSSKLSASASRNTPALVQQAGGWSAVTDSVEELAGNLLGFDLNIKGLATQITPLNVGIAALTASIMIMKDAFDEMIEMTKDFQRVDERLVQVNSNLRNDVQTQLENSRDLTGGLITNTEVLTEMRIAGFDTLNLNLVELGSRMKVTGQDTGSLIKASKDLANFGFLTQENLSNISDTLIESSLRNGTRLESMVSVLAALDKGTATQMNLVSDTATARLAEMAVGISSMVDEQGQASVKMFMESISKMDRESVAGLKRTGVMDEVLAALNQSSKLSQDQIKKLVTSIVSNQVAMKKAFQTAGDGTFEAAQALDGIGGNVLESSLALQKALERGTRDTGGIDNTEYLFENLKQRFLAPAMAAAKSMEPAFKTMKVGLANLGTSIINLVSNFAPVFSTLMSIVGIVAGIIGTVVNIVSTIIGGIKDLLGTFLTVIIKSIDFMAEGFGFVISELYRGILYILDAIPGIEYTEEERDAAAKKVFDTFANATDTLGGGIMDLVGYGDQFRAMNQVIGPDITKVMQRGMKGTVGDLAKASFGATAAHMEAFGATVDAIAEPFDKNRQALMDTTEALNGLKDEIHNTDGQLNQNSLTLSQALAQQALKSVPEAGQARVDAAKMFAIEQEKVEDLTGKIRAKFAASDALDDRFGATDIQALQTRLLATDSGSLSELNRMLSVMEDGNSRIGDLLLDLINSTDGVGTVVRQTANGSRNRDELRGGR